MALFASCVLSLIGCGNSSTDTAGILIETNTGNQILIETNTGNKPMARILVSVENLGAGIGDTLVVNKSAADTVGDTIYVAVLHYNRVFDSLEVASGVALLDSLPEGAYDSVQIRTIAGNVRDVAVDWVAASDTLLFDGAMSAEFKGVAEIELPDGFEDLVSSDEVFENTPFAVRLPDVTNPCLLDNDGNTILLSGTGESDVYWGVMPVVKFDEKRIAPLDIVANCQTENNLDLPLARRSIHFDDFSPSEAAMAVKREPAAVFGSARWTDSTDNWYYIDDLKPFSEDGYYMGLSIWFNVDSTQVKEYAQIISAKKDSVGFTLQRRGATGGVNLRLDTRTGVYNTVVGRANGVLDGTWHNYSFKIHGDSVTIFIDGTLLESRQFDAGEGFATVFNPGIGYGGFVGGIDEIFFFDGTQSENWMRLFYALQKHVLDDK